MNRITIEKSTLTDNYLVLVDGWVFDSCIKRSDAKKVRDWLKVQLEKNPRLSEQTFVEWLKQCDSQPPKTKAYALVNVGNKSIKTIIYA